MTRQHVFSGRCHCGAVRIDIDRRPGYMNDCNCTLCQKVRAVWGYLGVAEVAITGETRGYIRQDFAEPKIACHFCPACGCTTHWSPLSDTDEDRMGVNMRLFESDAVKGVELRFIDGRAWDGSKPVEMRKEPEIQ